MGSFRVLLVDDDSASVPKLERVLSDARYEVSSCSDPVVAERLLKTMRGRTVVILGHPAGKESATDFLERSLKAYPFTPFILCSSRLSTDDLVAAFRAGAQDFLPKPVGSEPLLQAVARATRRLELATESDAAERAARSELAALRTQLRTYRSQAAFKGFMISMAAHDFRSVLTILDGYHQILRQNCDRSCGKEIPVRMIEQAGRTIFRLQSMACTLFDVEASERGELRVAAVPFDYDALLRECAAFYRPYAAQKRVDLDIEDPLPPMRAVGDPARVLQIFDNLLYNAVKFTPADGRIRIEGRTPETGYVTAVVRDTGKGLPRSLVKELNSDSGNFPTKQDPDARIGMGLAICRRLVACQNGIFRLDSEQNRGTSVSISLPAMP